MAMTPREHIEEIRRNIYWIGREEQNPVVFKMLYKTVKLLSAELYAKEVHFLMELLQNAEDNEYPEEVDPSLEFVLTSRDITGTGAPATLLVFNNERGFSAKNMESICSAGLSTKEGIRNSGKIGEKGIGFKSVFMITAQPYIFSNGYQIRFSEDPCPHCNVAYMVPEWVEEKPSVADIKKIYGSNSTLPATTIILPLKPDKVKPVKQQLSSVHPELLLFLSKIKKLSVREHNENSGHNTVSSIAINSETESKTRKNINAESYTLHLSANGNEFDKECSYYMWRQKFSVKEENRDEKRMDIEEWVITLAFPTGERLQRGTTFPGVYAFLPTEMVTNFPFIIQADFRLASSRETILWGNKWNEGILNCVPSAFVNAFVSLVKLESAPVASLTWMFNFLPVNKSSYRELNAVRESIRDKLLEEAIIPSETYLEQNFFHKPCEVGRLMPAFWDLLKKASDQGVCLNNLSSHEIFVLNSAFDKEEYNLILDFLGVKPVNNEWYAKCIKSTNLVSGVSENVYSEMLLFLAENWSSKFSSANFGNIPLVKYADHDGTVSLCTINDLAAQTVWYTHTKVLCVSDHQSWLTEWNREFRCVGNRFFIPTKTYDAIRSCHKKEVLIEWLRKSLKVVTLTVNDYAGLLISHLGNDRKLAVAYAHFLYHSLSKGYISCNDVSYLCRNQMPLVDSYGEVSTRRSGVLVPANGSKWVQLVFSNPWREQGYIELGEDYLRPGNFAGQSTPGEQFLEFLKSYVQAVDIPHIYSPPNAGIPCVSAPLTKRNTFLLLDWIKNLRKKEIEIPQKLLACIKAGSWLKVSVNGYSGNRPPSESFFLTSTLGEILQNGSVLVDIPLVDQSFYGESIRNYTEELKTIGVLFEYAEACQSIGKRLMSMVDSSNVSKITVMSILNFIKFLVERFLSPESFIGSIQRGRWLKTCCGYRSPVESVLLDQEWKVASQVSNIPFIDQDYFGEEILRFKKELKLLGVIVGFSKNYQLVVDNLKSPADLSYLTAKSVLLVLDCMSYSTSANKLVQALRNVECLKTSAGYKSPGQCFLYDPEWGCLLQVFNDFAIIDEKFYGSTISSWKVELKKLGVVVDLDEAAKAFARLFRQKVRSSSISKGNVLLLLSCCRQLKKMAHNFPPEFESCIREENWLRTRLGVFRPPKECILFGPAWESIAPITALPFVDDSDSFYGEEIHEYSEELKSIGVVVKFEDGVKFVLDGLCSFLNPSMITAANVLALLECIRISKEKTLPESFFGKVSQKWLKTHAGDGYYSPKQCCLFDSKWESSLKLKQTDGPFLDGIFYGSEMKLYREELKQLGVAVDVDNICPLLASHLDFHSDFDTIVRIYNFLRESNWVPNSEAARCIWIPNGSENGQWVNPGYCVLHDKDGLFHSQLHVLEKHYDRKLLSFFSSAFEVKSNPSVDDYCKLWKVWESSGLPLSNSECFAFWRSVKRSKTQKHLADTLLQLPVNSGSDGILLLNKRDVFIADDLQLKDLFEQQSTLSLFVWYPQPSVLDLPRTELLEIYRNIGVRTISESVKREELSVEDGVELKQVNRGEISIGRGLLKLILGFLADLKLEARERHEAVECLLKLTALETAEPITVRYSLSLSTGETVVVSASQMIRWDKESLKFFTQKMDRSGGYEYLIEYATHFGEAISKGVLWNREEHTINALCELIKCGFLLEFNEAAVGFLMKSKNLQIFLEDEDFLSVALPPE